MGKYQGSVIGQMGNQILSHMSRRLLFGSMMNQHFMPMIEVLLQVKAV